MTKKTSFVVSFHQKWTFSVITNMFKFDFMVWHWLWACVVCAMCMGKCSFHLNRLQWEHTCFWRLSRSRKTEREGNMKKRGERRRMSKSKTTYTRCHYVSVHVRVLCVCASARTLSSIVKCAVAHIRLRQPRCLECRKISDSVDASTFMWAVAHTSFISKQQKHIFKCRVACTLYRLVAFT